MSGNTADNNIKVENDLFYEGLLSRIPKDMHCPFNEAQLSALKIAFGARQWKKHPVDIRGSINIWRWRYYYVFVAGRDRRHLGRKERAVSLFIKAFFLLILIMGIMSFLMLVLYLIKSAVGIDVFPGFSFGVWDWFKSNFIN